MAEKEKTQQKEQKSKKEAPAQKEAESKKRPSVAEQDHMESLIRIFGYDIPGSKNIYTGLTRIKGISWTISNALCLTLKMPRSKKISELSAEEIIKVEEAIRNLKVYDFLKNRRADPETGETSHFYGTDLDMKKEFDIKRMKEMRSYKGMRHSSRLPVRGQRTRSHFRAKKAASGGIKKKNDKKE